MSISVTIDGVDYASDHVRLRWQGDDGVSGLSSNADGTLAQGAIILDDPEGNIEIRSWMPVVVEESECSQPRLFTGYVASYQERRGRYTSGPGREIDITINDQNVLLALRTLTGGDSTRPAETDTERLDWLINSDYLDGIVFDTGFINPVGRDYDFHNFHGEYPLDVLTDLAGPRGQIFFAFWDPTEDKVGLFYDAPTAVTFTSILSFSNVPGVYDDPNDPLATCYPVRLDAVRDANGDSVYSNGRYQYKGGVVYRNNPTTASTYFPSPLLRRGVNIENDTVGRESTAITFMDRLLNGPYADERSTLQFSVELPDFQVGHILAGQRVQVQFAHITGFQDELTFTRVEAVTVAPLPGRRDWYEVYLTCSLTGLQTNGSGPGGPGGGDTTPFPQQPPGPPTAIQETHDNDGSTAFLVTPADGDLLVMAVTFRTGTPNESPGDGWTFQGLCHNANEFADIKMYGAVYTKTASSEANLYPQVAMGLGTVHTVEVTEWPAGTTFGQIQAKNDQQNTSAIDCGGTITPEANSVTFGLGVVGQFQGGGPTWNYAVTPAAGVTEYQDQESATNTVPLGWVAYKVGGTSISGTITTDISISSTYMQWGGLTWTIVGDTSTPETPPSGSPVGPETVTMSGADGTTASPFAPGSLRVFVDDTDQTGAILTYDADAGTFTLAFTPTPTEKVVVYYVSA